MRLNKSRSALLIVDVQRDFCPGGSLPVPEGDRIVPIINRLLGGFPKVVATQDWHPQEHVSFASNHPGKKPFESIELSAESGKQLQILWPDHCVPGTPGADFHPGLDVRGIDLVVRKGVDPNLDSYSAFFENDRLTPTGLSYYLQGLKLEELYLTGLATDVCVFYSAMDGIKLGFRTYLVQDAARGIDTPPGSLQQRLEEMAAAGIRIIQSSELEL